MLHNKVNTPLEMKKGVYKISCNYCECFYIGQTVRGFYKRFSEHIPKYNLKGLLSQADIKSYNARHLIHESHNYTRFDTNLKLLHILWLSDRPKRISDR